MKKLTVIAAALAAGMASFAHAQDNVAQNPAAIGKTAKNKKTGEAAADKCAYLFSCNQIDAVGRKPGARPVTAAAEAEKGQPAATNKIKRRTAKARAAKNAGVADVADAPKPRKGRTKIALKKDGKPVDLAMTAKASKGRTKIMLKKEGDAIDLMTTAAIRGEMTGATLVARQGPYHSIIVRYAGEYGVPVALAHAVISVESNYRPDITGGAGEIGLMQIKPATARMMGYSGSAKDLYNPETNIKFGMKYLGKAKELGGGTTCGTILKYNAGHGATRMNPVSSAYCSKVKRYLGA